MNTQTTAASDLVWNLEKLVDKEGAANFLRQFERSLCVFSSAVQQLYASYSISKVNKAQGNLVVLPNPYAPHDTFQSIRHQAVVGTGLFIVPAKVVGKEEGLYLMKRNASTGKFQSVPLVEGLKRLKANATESNPFLPVITNKDLRELPNRAPILHLHRIDCRKLANLSSFQRGDIATAIGDKMATLAQVA